MNLQNYTIPSTFDENLRKVAKNINATNRIPKFKRKEDQLNRSRYLDKFIKCLFPTWVQI